MLEVILIGGVLTALSAIIILHKIKKKRYEDAAIDAGISWMFMFLFAGSLIGSSIAIVASLVLSIYLLFFGDVNQVRQFIKEVRKIVKEHM